jgi:hypothetical protein
MLASQDLELSSCRKKRPIAFFSQCLGPKMDAKSVYEKEALAILHALKKWRHYFLGNLVIIKTDQQALKYLGNQDCWREFNTN